MFSWEDRDGSALWLLSDAVIVDGRVGGAALTLCDCLGLAPVALDVAELSLSSSRIFAASARNACLFGIAEVDDRSCLRGVAARI